MNENSSITILLWVFGILITTLLTIIGFFIKGKFSYLETAITGIKNNLQIITTTLIRKKIMSKDETRLLQATSPISLTEQARAILDQSGFISVFNQNKNKFFQYILSENVKTRLDVELSAIKSVLLLFDNDFMNPIKTYLYNNPNMQLDLYSKIAGVYIRDKFLEEHPEITA